MIIGKLDRDEELTSLERERAIDMHLIGKPTNKKEKPKKFTSPTEAANKFTDKMSKSRKSQYETITDAEGEKQYMLGEGDAILGGLKATETAYGDSLKMAERVKEVFGDRVDFYETLDSLDELSNISRLYLDKVKSNGKDAADKWIKKETGGNIERITEVLNAFK